MKEPRLEVIPNKPIDEEKARLMEMLVNELYAKNREFIEAVARARLIIEEKYGIKTDEQPWDTIMSAYVAMQNKLSQQSLDKGGEEND